ncbi:MAG: hypothetical protein F4059_06150 [Gemmatimonadetes bacterium]|nr:hypothetical protein [Gemmatimonadota bacterium]
MGIDLLAGGWYGGFRATQCKRYAPGRRTAKAALDSLSSPQDATLECAGS